METKTKLASLDCSTTCSGIALWEDGKYLSSHIINCEGIRDVTERQKEMGIGLWEALSYHSPDIVYIEDTYCHGNPEVQKKLNRIQGVVFAWCIMNKTEFHCIMPSAWRKYIEGFPNGKNAKREVQKAFSKSYVEQKYGFEPITDDQSDAILIGEGVLKMYEENGY